MGTLLCMAGLLGLIYSQLYAAKYGGEIAAGSAILICASLYCLF